MFETGTQDDWHREVLGVVEGPELSEIAHVALRDEYNQLFQEKLNSLRLKNPRIRIVLGFPDFVEWLCQSKGYKKVEYREIEV